MSRSLARLRGLSELLVDAVDHGAAAVEKVHLGTADRTFVVLEAIPGIDLPAKAIHTLHDFGVRAAYGSVRAVTRIVGVALDTSFDAVADLADVRDETSTPRSDDVS